MDPAGDPDLEGRSDRVEYEPVSVKAVLAEMKDTAELLIDLAYSAVLLGSPDVAEEVLELEARMDVLQLRARMSLLLAARSAEDAEALAPVLGIIGAAEGISDAAGDIAKVTREDIGLPESMRAALPEAVETVERAAVADDSPLAGATLGDRNLETDTGVRVIAIHRGGDGDWLTNPDRTTALRAGDVLILRGPREGVGTVHEEATGEPLPVQPDLEPADADLVRAVDSIVLLKNMSELAVDLAYGAVLYDSTELAEEVLELEAEVDALQSRFEAWVLRAASRVEDPVSLRGLVHLATATEGISDAALEISEGVLRGLGTHPVVTEAVLESDEVVVRLGVAAGSDLDGATLAERAVETETGMRVIGVRRGGGATATEAGDPGEGQADEGVAGAGPPADPGAGDQGADDQPAADREWVVQPRGDTRLRAGDVVLAKGTRSGAARLAAMCGREPPVEDD